MRALVLSVLLAAPALAAAQVTFTVDTETDSLDVDPGDGACATSTGACSLRAAIMETNALPGRDVVYVPPGEYGYPYLCPHSGEDPCHDFDIRGDLDLVGSGTATILGITGDMLNSRILEVHPGATVLVAGVRISGGTGWGVDGGGVLNRGVLTLREVAVVGNQTLFTGDDGGGIYNTGTLTVERSLIASNRVGHPVGGAEGNDGGGIYTTGPLRIRNSTITWNHARFEDDEHRGGDGGGVYATGNAAHVVIEHSTITRNRAGGHGSAALGGLGGGVYAEGGAAATLLNSVVAGNAPGCVESGGADCGGTVSSLGHNVLAGEGDCAASTGDVLVDSSAVFTTVLGSLGDHGGPTETYALLAGSPAIDAATCVDTDGQPVTLDQRRYVRGAPCDVGAFEFGAAPTAAESPTGGAGPVALAVAGPNPLAVSTTLVVQLRRAGSVRLAVYDVLGRVVAVLLSGEQTAGRHTVVLDAAALAPGVYFARA
ncbi:MAG TPA: T9SS type A sorting domain-containing protein, partial [Rubricoccaceae bacterium]|nr:T9SS type A sorting domain-containing protein [Rubricoccaceae bacterium]